MAFPNGSLIMVKLSFFFMLIPFVSPYPVQTDTQPFSLLLAILVLVTHFSRIKVSIFDCLFFSVALLSLFFVREIEFLFDVRKGFVFLASFTYWIFVKTFYKELTTSVVFAASLVMLSSQLLLAFSPEAILPIFEQIVRSIKITDFTGARGLSGLAPEPGFAGALGAAYCGILFFLKNKSSSSLVWWISFLFGVSIVILSKSGTGYMLLIIIAAVYTFLNFSAPKMVFYLFVLVVLVLLLPEFTNNRGLAIAEKLMANPLELLLKDESVGKRALNIALGFLSVLENPLGIGRGLNVVYREEIVSSWELRNYMVGESGDVSAFSRFAVELGLVFMLFIVFLVLRTWSFKYIYLRLLGFLFISASFSFSFPIIWILLGIDTKSDDDIREAPR